MLLNNFDKIINYIKKDEQNKLLICGPTKTGKTELSIYLSNYFTSLDFNIIHLNCSYNNDNDKIKSFYHFFNINFKQSKITLKINNDKIDYYFNFNNISDKNNNIIYTIPNKMTTDYELIFSKPRFFTQSLNIKFNMRNIIIIDETEKLEMIYLIYLDKALKDCFNNEKIFGGLDIILLGNDSFFYEKSLFDMMKYIQYNDKLLSHLNKINITKQIILPENFIKYLPHIRKTKRINLSEFNFIRSRDIYNPFNNITINIKKNDFYVYPNNSYIYEKNKPFIIKKENKYFNIISEDSFIDKIEFFKLNKQLQNYYLNTCLEKKLLVRKGMKIIFTKNIKDENIKKGDIGYIKDDIIDNVVIDEEVPVKNIPNINIILSSGREVSINPYIINLKNIFRKIQFPFVPGYCISVFMIKFLKDINKLVIVIKQEFYYNLFIQCLFDTSCKKDNIFFKNSLLLSDPDFFLR